MARMSRGSPRMDTQFPSRDQVKRRVRFLHLAIEQLTWCSNPFYVECCPNPAFGSKRQWEKTCLLWRVMMRRFKGDTDDLKRTQTRAQVRGVGVESRLPFINVDDLSMLGDDEDELSIMALSVLLRRQNCSDRCEVDHLRKAVKAEGEGAEQAGSIGRRRRRGGRRHRASIRIEQETVEAVFVSGQGLMD